MAQRDAQRFGELSDSAFSGWAFKLRLLPFFHFSYQRRLNLGNRLTDDLLTQAYAKMGRQVVLDAPKDIYEQVKRLAVTTERDIADILLETIPCTFSPFRVDPNRTVLNQNVESHKDFNAEFLMTHKGQFAAICEGKLVDHDPDPVSLLKRVRTHYPDRVVLRRKVETVQEQQLRIRHPRTNLQSVATSIPQETSSIGHGENLSL